MRIAITGASGLLGRHLIPRLANNGHTIVASKHSYGFSIDRTVLEAPLDLADDDSIIAFVETSAADLVIHGAAMTDVDGCERNPEQAKRINADATRVLANAVRRANKRIVYISTDYVFDGTDGPYDESRAPNPINVYGATKLRGEEAVLNAGSQSLVVRAAGYLGPGLPGKPTFAERTAQRILHDPPVRVAIDQKSNITPIEFLADGIVDLIEEGIIGIRHVAPEEIVSRYEFAAMLAEILGAPKSAVEGVPYAKLNRDAARPLDGGLISQFPRKTKCPTLKTALESFKALYLSTDNH
ncbi:MAG: dTDP-4-dehydrorhamnose reductase [Candidatus Zixiibacteriota bacterium]